MQQIKDSRLLRYAISGLSAFLADYGSFLFLYYLLHLPILVSNSLSFIISLAISFGLNRNWTFKDSTTFVFKAHQQILMFVLLSFINFLLSNSLIYLLNVRAHLTAAVAKLVVICCIALWNYVIYQQLIFKKKR